MFEAVFKYPREVFETGTLVFAPVADGRWWIAVLAAAALLIGASVVAGRRVRTLTPPRRLTLGALQTAFVATAVLLLARPALEIATLAPGANTVAVLLDASKSMGFPEGGTGVSRLDAAQAVLDETLLPSLSDLAEVETFAFGEAARRRPLADLRATAPHTHLVESAATVIDSFRGVPLAAVVVISDGADNAAAGIDLDALAAAGVPVHTVGVGPLTLPGEVQLVDVTLPSGAPPESRVTAEVVLRHDTQGAAVLRVRDGTTLLTARPVQLDAATPTQRIALTFDSGPGGIRELAFEVEPPPGDTLAENNRRQRLLTVSERRRRVLYLEGEPRWEYKFIRRAVAGDDVLRMTSWLRTTDNKTYRQNIEDAEALPGGFPKDLASLYDFDVIVLGSLGAAYLNDTQHARLESFVAERGGSVLALAGRDALADGGWDVTPLGKALPVALPRRDGSTYGPVEGRVRPTRAGVHSPVTALIEAEGGDAWTSLPPLGDYQRIGALKPAATVLLEVVIDGEARPLLVTQPYGLGTTAVLATATTWRWQMRTPPDDARHALFWRQLLRQLAETAQRPRDVAVAVRDETLTVRLTERDETFAPIANLSASATVTGPGVDGARIPLTATDSPGTFTGRYRPPAAGLYRVDVDIAGDDAAVTRFVRVGATHQEQFDPVQNAALLERVAAVTGGRYWSLAEADGIAEALTFTAAGVKRLTRLPLWDMPAAFLLLLVLKGSEWLLRRRWGRI